MSDELGRFSRRQIVGGLGIGLASMIETPRLFAIFFVHPSTGSTHARSSQQIS